MGVIILNLLTIQSLFPNFNISDFKMFNEIISLNWETVIDDITFEKYKYLTLEMVSSTSYKILMEFKNVNSFRFKGDGKISGFYIKDMSVMGYESNSKYEVGDYENDEIEFYCSDIEIKKIGKIEF